MTSWVLKKYFRQLDRLQKIIFSCYIKRDYAENQFYYEKKIHVEKQNLFKIICHIRKKIPSLRAYFQENGKGVKLYEIILSLDMLKLRISDHATFEVCQHELERITSDISSILKSASLGQEYIADLSSLSQAIERFSELYQSTLRVITAEPPVFLFFIQDLIDFNEVMESFFLKPENLSEKFENVPSGVLQFKINKINWPHIFSMALAVIISFIAAYYLGFFGMYLIPLVALLVMQTSIANAFDQGVSRVLMLAIFTTGLAIVIQSMPFLYQAMHDIGIGAVIGIATNLLVFPRRADKEFRFSMVDVMRCYKDYFMNTIEEFTQGDTAPVNKIFLDKQLLSLPGWVYQRGFDTTLRAGHRFFLITIEQISNVLFSMHYLANCPLDQELVEQLQPPLTRCADYIKDFFSGLITLLELKRLTHPIADFSDELDELEEKFQLEVPLSLEFLDVKRDYVYIAAFIYNLTTLRRLLLKLAQALR